VTAFADEGDTRKVQTAVIGRAGPDTPVFLPYGHDEFDLFMRGRSRDDFYCGTCGMQKPRTVSSVGPGRASSIKRSVPLGSQPATGGVSGVAEWTAWAR
jgi:hypothetical protein